MRKRSVRYVVGAPDVWMGGCSSYGLSGAAIACRCVVSVGLGTSIYLEGLFVGGCSASGPLPLLRTASIDGLESNTARPLAIVSIQDSIDIHDNIRYSF